MTEPLHDVWMNLLLGLGAVTRLVYQDLGQITELGPSVVQEEVERE